MKIGQKVTARLNEQKIILYGEVYTVPAKEKEVTVVSIEGDRLRVSCDGILLPDDFILTEGQWRTKHNWYLRQEIPELVLSPAPKIV